MADHNNEMDLQSLSGFTDTGPPTPTTSVFPHRDKSEEVIVADPKTPAGQQVGAVLLIKSKPRFGSNFANRSLEVSELVKIIEHVDAHCKVKPLRKRTILDDTWDVPWSSFFPLSIKTRCSCKEGACRCEIDYPWRCIPPDVADIPNESPVTETVLRAPTPAVIRMDPHTLEGQTPGAILRIECHVKGNTRDHEDCPVQVGDYVKLLSGLTKDCGRVVPAKNSRTGVIGHIIWLSVFPLKEREVCYCYHTFEGRCRCVYMDFEKSRAYWKAPK